MPTTAERQAKIAIIREFPPRLEETVARLDGPQLDTPVGPGEWSPRQIIHHLADSHLNSFIRLKLILTEEHPTLKPYHQEAWALLPDTATMPVEPSLAILRGLHQRWTSLFASLSDPDWHRTGHHPELGTITADDLLDIYARHCDEHLEQITRIFSTDKE